jgi:hypothetical protein
MKQYWAGFETVARTMFNVFPPWISARAHEIVEVKNRMNLKAMTILGLIVFAALIGTRFAAT